MEKENVIVRRIRKLLALARDKGASENETAEAMRIASDLMMKHNIDSVDEERAPGIIEGETIDDLTEKWHVFLVTSIGILYDCNNVQHSLGRYSYYGRPLNVSACEETLPFVMDQVQELYKQGLKAFKDRMGRLDKKARGEFRTTFKEACALRVFKIVKEIKAAQKNQIPDHKALVVIEDIKAEIVEFETSKGFEDRKALAPRKSGFGTGAGYEAGAHVKLQGRVNK